VEHSKSLNLKDPLVQKVNKRLLGTFANVDDLNEQTQDKIVTKSIFKHSMMLKSFKKQE